MGYTLVLDPHPSEVAAVPLGLLGGGTHAAPLKVPVSTPVAHPADRGHVLGYVLSGAEDCGRGGGDGSGCSAEGTGVGRSADEDETDGSE